MNGNHLSEWEQEKYLLGECTPAAERHLLDCAECRAAAERLENGVAWFRESALSWSAECAETHLRRKLPRRAPRHGFAHGWAAGCAAAGLAAAMGLVAVLPHARQTTAAPSAPPSMSDDALLEQVDQQVSGSVPEAMQPLARAAAR